MVLAVTTVSAMAATVNVAANLTAIVSKRAVVGVSATGMPSLVGLGAVSTSFMLPVRVAVVMVSVAHCMPPVGIAIYRIISHWSLSGQRLLQRAVGKGAENEPRQGRRGRCATALTGVES